MENNRKRMAGNLTWRMQILFLLLCFVILSACKSSHQIAVENGEPEMQAHYVEIVSMDVDKQCKVLEEVYGLSFGLKVQELGLARVAKTSSGVSLGVRAPMAEHEQPIVRIYFAVDDINKAVKKAEAAGAVVAYPPTRQGETGTWAIYILDGIQYGLWQK